MKEVEIDYDQKWLQIHARSIQSAYGNAPFYEYYSEEIFKILNEKHKFLLDLNLKLLTKCLHFLGIRKTIQVEDHYNKIVPEGYYDARNGIHPKTDAKGKVKFKVAPYLQVFGKDFDNNLSIIDLIFCEGPNASSVITNSKWNI